MNQMPLFAVESEPVWNGLFWAHCTHINDKHSLVWLPPEQKVGECVYCKMKFEFQSVHGKEEAE